MCGHGKFFLKCLQTSMIYLFVVRAVRQPPMFKLKLQILMFDIKLEENVQLYRDYHFHMRKMILTCCCVKLVFPIRTLKKTFAAKK